MTNKQKIVAYVDNDTKQKLQDICKKYDMSESKIVNLVIKQWIAGGGKIEIK